MHSDNSLHYLIAVCNSVLSPSADLFCNMPLQLRTSSSGSQHNSEYRGVKESLGMEERRRTEMCFMGVDHVTLLFGLHLASEKSGYISIEVQKEEGDSKSADDLQAQEPAFTHTHTHR